MKKSAVKSPYREGLRDGIPIALGYFAVSFSLGIAAKAAGLDAVQGFLASLLNNASAGEYAGFLLIGAGAPYWEMALMTLVTNARYLLMSCALSQRFSQRTPFFHRFLIGTAVTDEIFGISVARKGPLDPFYHYGAMSVAMPAWAVGTSLGILAGNVLPVRVVSALSVALYGMFLAIIIPPAKKNRVVLGLVAAGFLFSFLLSVLPFFDFLSEGTRTILLTVLIAGAGAYFFPIKPEEVDTDGA
ncbi:MAG: AzlC family ABC transporter permease [Clostridia bacterium]|nr:AzlC family ABC transporter permease [Clostridia bacterium]